MNDADRKAAEQQYSITAFDYASNPIGSRDWILYLNGFQAACEWRDSQVGEVFGYFKCNPDGWVDCAETDEGAIALYEAPPTAQINQQMLEALEAFINAWGDCLGHPDTENERFRLSEARDKAESAVLAAATQMRGDA